MHTGADHLQTGAAVRPTTLVVGLGNPLLGDDGVGWHVARLVGSELAGDSPPVEVDCLAVGGLSLMERLAGYKNAIIVDALFTGQQPPGSLCCLSLDDLPGHAAGHVHSAHDTSLPVALRAGAALGVALPRRVLIVGIEAHTVYDFDERLSPAVAACVPLAVAAVIQLVYQLEREKGIL